MRNIRTGEEKFNIISQESKEKIKEFIDDLTFSGLSDGRKYAYIIRLRILYGSNRATIISIRMICFYLHCQTATAMD